VSSFPAVERSTEHMKDVSLTEGDTYDALKRHADTHTHTERERERENNFIHISSQEIRKVSFKDTRHNRHNSDNKKKDIIRQKCIQRHKDAARFRREIREKKPQYRENNKKKEM
jgi:hypothetical protein